MLFPIALVLLGTISCQTSPLQPRSYFRGISSDEMDTQSSFSDESNSRNKTFGGFLRNYPYSQQRSGQSSYMLLGLGQNGRLFLIPDANESATSSVIASRRPTVSAPKCGIVPQFNSDIGNNFNNSFVTNGQIPWQAALFTADGQFLCSGVLVSPKHVLTAAVCLLTLEYVKLPHLLEVRVGAWDMRGMVSSSEEQNYYFATTPSQIDLYPEMNVADTTDIKTSKVALLELKERVNMTKHVNIRPICLESLPLPSKQNRTLHDSSSETSTNVIDDKKTEGHGKRSKKEFMLKKKTHQLTRKKPTLHRLTGPKFLTKGSNTDFLECYVSGWGSRSQSAVSFLSKQMQKHDIEERAAITSLTLPIIPGGKYIVHSDPSLPPKEMSDEVTAWQFKSTTSEETSTKQETGTSESGSDSELATILQDILGAPSSNTRTPSIPNFDPIEDYLDSVEIGPRTNSPKVDSSKATQSKSRKKQLKPDREFRESVPNVRTFDPMESDELLVDKQDADEEDHRRGLTSNSHNLRLRWALVTMHNVSSADHADLGLGTSYLKATRSTDPDALCMVDIGSPIICRKRSSVFHAKPSNMYKILAGIVTWKLPCFGPKTSDDIAFAMNDLETNYNLVQVTPINEILDFITERVKVSETEITTSTTQATGTEAAVGTRAT